MSRPAPTRKRQRNKVVVSFDMDARNEYITGFRKRRADRRKKALEDIAKRERSDKSDRRRMRREAIQETLEEAKRKREEAGMLEGPEEDAASRPETSEMALDSEFSRKAFGDGAVVVSTTLGPEEEGGEEERLAREVKRMKAAYSQAKGEAYTQAKLKVPTLQEIKEKKKQRYRQKKPHRPPSKRDKKRGGRKK